MESYSLKRTRKLALIKAKVKLIDQLEEGELFLDNETTVISTRFASATCAVFDVVVFTNQGSYRVPIQFGVRFTVLGDDGETEG